MNNEKTLDGALCAGVGTADAATAQPMDASGSAPAEGKKKYVPPTMQVIPLGPQRLLATSGALPHEEYCYVSIEDPLGAACGGDCTAEIRQKITAGNIKSNPRQFVQDMESLGLGHVFSYYNGPDLKGLLNSAVITDATIDLYTFHGTGASYTYVDFSFALDGYVPDEYAFHLEGFIGSYGSSRVYFPPCVEELL
ncbi:MAG: hypothetical protein IJ722_06870, partial [Alloprevotella sp.]|nr:hypothetical protein [Alloprevotella sp.]